VPPPGQGRRPGQRPLELRETIGIGGLYMMKRIWKVRGILLGLVVALTSGCQPVADAWVTGWTGAAAQGQIMLVRRDPPSLGQQRLLSQSGVYPDLGVFLHARGLPDFVAETTTRNRHFLILYYLATKHAYACQAKAPATRQIEFAGPYPITRREYQLLRGFKQQAGGGPAAWTPPQGGKGAGRLVRTRR
jgi:hypothetical protein